MPTGYDQAASSAGRISGATAEKWRANILVMAYKRINTSAVTDPDVKEILDRTNDLLADVYTMCCTAWLKRLKAGECNLAAALVLTSIIDALAAHVYPLTKAMPQAKGVQQARFEKLVADRLFWPTTWMPVAQAAMLLYVECRNPLTHAVGREPANVSHRPSGFIDTTVGIWGYVKPKQMRVIDRWPTWPEKWPTLAEFTDAKGSRYKLTVVALYWGVKEMARGFAK